MGYPLECLFVFAIIGLLHGCSDTSNNDTSRPQDDPPNILFIMLDDVGIDQMQS